MINASIQEKQELIAITLTSLLPVVKRSLEKKKVFEFDLKLQRSYFLVGKK
jgi:hypothetical protein